ncbi:MAG: AAA family ATPase [Clostridia bacterium]|nr:AAA family ATPase [Clostridia bacterium]
MGNNSNRRVRCFICNRLVPRSYADIENYDDDESFALVTLRISNKIGCICSGCITYYALQLGTTFEFSSGKFGNNPNGNNGTLTDYGFSDDDDDLNEASASASSAITTVKTVEEKSQDEKDLELFRQKYDCLDYSLDSLAAIVEKTVFGQHESVQKFLYALYFNQMANLMEDLGDEPFKHKHIMLIGGTGVGKTLLATTAARAFGVVYSVSNATPITSAGYIGDKVENVLERLLDAAKGNIELAQNGVVILDEIDKKRAVPDGSGRDVVGKAVQQELLKLLEPSTIWIKHNSVPFYTGNLTVVMMGAFVGLEEIIQKRSKKTTIGFGAQSSTMPVSMSQVTADDLIEYGFIPEMIGRIPIISPLNDLSHSTIVDIIYSHLERYNKFFKIKNFELYFDPLLVNKIADEVIAAKTGARDVEVRLDEVLRPALYRIFQSQPNGVCEVGENGEINILLHNKKNPKILEAIDFPPVEKYIDEDE